MTALRSSLSEMPASFSMREAVEFTLSRASSRGSTLTNSSPMRVAMSCARLSTCWVSLEK